MSSQEERRVKGETIDPRIVPGSLIELNQRLKYIPIDARDHPDFDINRATVPIWKATDAGPGAYEPVPSGSCAIVLDRYVKNDVTKLKILINDAVYHCYGIHADLAGWGPWTCNGPRDMV